MCKYCTTHPCFYIVINSFANIAFMNLSLHTTANKFACNLVYFVLYSCILCFCIVFTVLYLAGFKIIMIHFCISRFLGLFL